MYTGDPRRPGVPAGRVELAGALAGGAGQEPVAVRQGDDHVQAWLQPQPPLELHGRLQPQPPRPGRGGFGDGHGD